MPRMKSLELLGLEAEALERVVLDDRFLLQEPQDHLLAVDGGQRRDAEVDLPAAGCCEAKLPSCGQPALGDVETRDDLEPRHHGQVERARHLEEVEQEPVDPVADARPVLVGLDVDVGGAVGGGAVQHVVDDLDDGRVGRLRPQLLEIDGLSITDTRWPTLRPRSCRRASSTPSRGDHPTVGLVDGLLDGLAGADLEVHVQAGRPPEVVEGDHVERIRGGDDELAARGARRR